jgi:spermidine/putrescine transport system ATP-binding protein
MVEIREVSRSFAGVPAVESVSLSVAEGEFVTLLGPSGCGKTTLLRIVAGLETADEGRVEVDGRDVSDLPAHKRPVNLVFQRVTLFPHLNVFDNVAFGLQLQKLPKDEIRKRVAEGLELVGMASFEKRSPSTLSGGQAQRISLARALVNRPRVLLLDEPLSALDLQIRRQLQRELRQIHRELGVTFLYVTHDQEEAMTMSDRIVVMRDGVIQQEGSPSQVYRQPASQGVARFLGTSNMVAGTVAAVEGEVALVECPGFRTKVHGMTLEHGQAVMVVLRPEAIELSPGDDNATDMDALTGTVRDVEFLGPLCNFIIDGPGVSLVISQRSSDSDQFKLGDRVTAHWHEGLPLVFADPQAAAVPAADDRKGA